MDHDDLHQQQISMFCRLGKMEPSPRITVYREPVLEDWQYS